MKKFVLVITTLLLSISLYSQNENYNRLLLHNNGDIKGFVIDEVDSLTFSATGNNISANVNINGIAESYNIKNIDSISFASVKGAVAANIEILEHSLSSVLVNITRTTSCAAFKLTCFPANFAASMNDNAIAQYVNSNISNTYYEDFSNVQLNASFEPNSGYVLVTIGFDRYGILCDVVRAPFTTQSESLVGEPDVEVKIIENNFYDVTLKFIPNKDVSEYYVMLAEKGTIEQQCEYFGAFNGWSNIGDMVEDWGLKYTSTATYQWTDQTPNTEYEVFIQMRDKEYNRTPYKVFTFKSKSTGGEGTAEVEITLGAYKLNDWYGELLPSQFFTFTPNDQASKYRFNVVLAENYDADVEGYKEDLCSDPSMSTIGWYQYEELTTDYQIDPNTSCVAIAAAKNVNDEWGPITELRYTTPNTPGAYSVGPRNIIGRKLSILANKAITLEMIKE